MTWKCELCGREEEEDFLPFHISAKDSNECCEGNFINLNEKVKEEQQ